MARKPSAAPRRPRAKAQALPAAPRYQQILDALKQQIESGRYPVGASLPTEGNLCIGFAASRHTVREALRRLVELGLVARRQGSGSIVLARSAPKPYLQKVDSLADLFQFALDTDYKVASMRMVAPTPEVLQAINEPEGGKWLCIVGVRKDRPGGKPICFTRSYVPARLAWLRAEFSPCVGPFYAMIEARTREPIIEALQEFRAQMMPDEIADALDQPRGSLALCILRRYVSSAGTLIASFNWHPADEFVYRMRLQRAGLAPVQPAFGVRARTVIQHKSQDRPAPRAKRNTQR